MLDAQQRKSTWLKTPSIQIMATPATTTLYVMALEMSRGCNPCRLENSSATTIMIAIYVIERYIITIGGYVYQSSQKGDCSVCTQPINPPTSYDQRRTQCQRHVAKTRRCFQDCTPQQLQLLLEVLSSCQPGLE
eukprot:m.63977 g.63977  ORF g.63977 m.63977 type:complete len:134 (+) comp13987_c0_seq8:162-563(+)